MRMLLFADPHISAKGEFASPTPDGLTTYLHQVQRSFDWLCTLVAQWQPDIVACLGDLFESVGYVETASLTVATECITKLRNTIGAYCGEPDPSRFLFVMGNHDCYQEQFPSHNLAFLRQLGVTVYDRPELVDYRGIKFSAVPWMSDLSKFYIYPGSAFVLTHVDVLGGVLHASKKADFGVNPAHFCYPVFNGHFHWFDNPAPHWTNISSLLSRTFRDANSPAHGAMLVMYDSNRQEIVKVMHLPNPHDVPFRTIAIGSDAEAQVWRSKLESGDPGVDGCNLRVTYDVAYEEVAQQLGYLAANTRMEPTQTIGIEVHPTVVDSRFSPADNFREYVDAVFLFEKEGDRERILERGLHYVQVVQNAKRSSAQPLRFTHLHGESFQALDTIDVDLDQRGLIYVEGRNEDKSAFDSNGSAKSTIPELIYWIITGTSLRGYRADEVIHWDRACCLGELVLSIGSTEYRIVRCRKYPQLGTTVKVWKGADEITLRKASDTDTLIMELIGRSETVLQHTIMLTSDLTTRFTALTAADRVRLIEQITDAEVYDAIRVEVDSDFRKAKQEAATLAALTRSAEMEIATLTTQLQQLNGSISEIRRVEAVKLVDARKRLAETTALVEEKKKECADTDVLLDTLVDQLAHMRAERNALGEQYATVNDRTTIARTQYAERIERIREMRMLIAKKQCPTCGQSITTGTYADAMKQQKEFATGYDLILAECTPQQEALSLDMQVKDAEIDVTERARIACARDAVAKAGQLKELQMSLQLTQTFLDSGGGKDLARLQGQREEQVKRLEETKTKLGEGAERFEALKETLSDLGWLYDAFSPAGIRAKMMAAWTVPFLNKQLERYSIALGQACAVTTEKEHKSGTTKSSLEIALPSGHSYRGCSRGERRRIDLAIQLALNDLALAVGGASVNLLVCDEVIDPLDDVGVRGFVELLIEKVARDKLTILLMSHKPFTQGLAPHCWRVTKSRGLSTLEEIS